MTAQFRIDTFTIDRGTPRAWLYCVTCRDAGRSTSQLAGEFRSADLADLTALAARHECPPEVK